MVATNKFCVSSVKLTPLEAATGGELCESIYRKCAFCEKNCMVQPITRHVLEKLNGPGRFCCSFCIRHGFHTKNNRNVLILSFRSIIGHFYYQNYVLANTGHKMYLADIGDYIESHIETGLLNPLFSYDPETFLWFIDFSKIGQSKKKILVRDVMLTVVDILACFNLAENVPGISQSSLFIKYKEAILNFYKQRFRPPDRKMLIPTFAGCLPGAGSDKTNDKVRNFTNSEMIGKK